MSTDDFIISLFVWVESCVGYFGHPIQRSAEADLHKEGARYV